jgi:phospholipid/cholesterol/gamma-HCH transport system substrate-binding protein
MEEKTSKRLRVGIFVIVATTCLILGLYFIGSKRNMFQSKINVSAVFNNINGLMPGNNVQFNGINVGTVSKVYAIADTAIKVEFTLEENVAEFVSITAIASIGTDGLLGNKMITIAPSGKTGALIKDGDVMKTKNPLEIDKAIYKLMITNDNLEQISENLKQFSAGFNTPNSLWQLLSDTAIAENIRKAFVHIEVTTNRTAILTGDLSNIVKDVKAGKGTIGALIMDTTISHKLKQTIVHFETVTDSFAIITGNFKQISEKINSGKGALGTLVSDTSFAHNLNASMENIKVGSKDFDESMKALQHTWPFKKYFKKKAAGKE